MAMSEAAKAVKAAYNRKWKQEHPERVREAKRKWRKENPDKVRASNERYWERKAAEQKAADQP